MGILNIFNFNSLKDSIYWYNKYNNFDKIKCREKFCIDPDPNAEADFELTSDEFFKINHKKYDCIFVDGLHEAHQVYKDI